MDILGLLALRTAAPFGYLLLLLALVVAAAVGLAQLSGGFRARPRHRSRVLAGGALLSGVAVVVAANLAYDAALDLNPRVTAADIAGAWRDGPATLDLRTDGTYRCGGGTACAPLGAGGQWAHDGDFQLLFTPRGADRPVVQRVVRYAGQLRLTEKVGDPDMWSGVLTFRHPAPAS
jgi:hypothetical protein